MENQAFSESGLIGSGPLLRLSGVSNHLPYLRLQSPQRVEEVGSLDLIDSISWQII